MAMYPPSLTVDWDVDQKRRVHLQLGYLLPFAKALLMSPFHTALSHYRARHAQQYTLTTVGLPAIDREAPRAYDGYAQAFMHIAQHQGFTGLFRGLVPCLSKIPLSIGLGKATNQLLRQLAHSETRSSGAPDRSMLAVAGFVSDYTAQALLYPFLLLETRLAADIEGSTSAGMLDCVNIIRMDEGLAGFYHGLGASLLATFLSSVAAYGLYNIAGSVLFSERDHMHRLEPWQLYLVFHMIPVAADALTYPLTTVALTQQVAGQKEEGLLATARKIHEKEGLPGFFHGIIPSIILQTAAALILPF